MLVVLPFWTSFLIRIYAWINILQRDGLLNEALIALGIVDAPVAWLATDTAIYIGIVYSYLPFMVLPLYATLEKMDETLLEAAADLGCPRWKAFWLVTVPLSLPGIVAGALLCFIPIVGEFVIPDLLGGSDALMIGQTLWTRILRQPRLAGGLRASPSRCSSSCWRRIVYNQQKSKFEFRAGPIIGQIILADEINRATPKTQAALLEAMEERQVTVDGATHVLPRPFMVLATQNPIEYEGTFPLPEAQLDRFLLRVRLGYPDFIDEMRIIDDQQLKHPIEMLRPVAKATEVLKAAQAVRSVYLSSAAKRYVADLSRRTRQSSDIYLGASPRGTIFLSRASQARAGLNGRSHVLPDDVKEMAVAVLAHRLIVSPAARLRELSADRIMQEIVRNTPVPGGDFGPAPAE